MHTLSTLLFHSTVTLSPVGAHFYPQDRFALCLVGRSFFAMTTSADQAAHPMREPCPRCGCRDGTITTRSGQDTVRCAECKQYCYNAPRSETGRERRSLSTRPDVRPRQRSRIMLRDNFACIMCHRSDVPLEIGHLVSVHDAHLVGLSDAELTSDDNLAVMCEECNSGLSKQSLPPRLIAAAIFAHRLHEREGGQRPALKVGALLPRPP